MKTLEELNVLKYHPMVNMIYEKNGRYIKFGTIYTSELSTILYLVNYYRYGDTNYSSHIWTGKFRIMDFYFYLEFVIDINGSDLWFYFSEHPIL
jgi:hypothetical protein